MTSMIEKVAGIGTTGKRILKGVGIGAAGFGLGSLMAQGIGHTVGQVQGQSGRSYKGRDFITEDQEKRLNKYDYPERDDKARNVLIHNYKERNPGKGQRFLGALSGKRALWAGRGLGSSVRLDKGRDGHLRSQDERIKELEREAAHNRIRRY